jgi:hypothetical protein
MKCFIISILFFISVFTYGQNNSNWDNAEVFKEELQLFADSIQASLKKTTSSYLVFVGRFYGNSKKSFCFTLGYILNSVDLNFVAPNYVYYFKDQPVVISIDSINKVPPLLRKELKEFNLTERKKVSLKLFPSEDGGFTYRSTGLTFCQQKGNVERKWYTNSDEIPFEKSIYKRFPMGGTIKKMKSK